jgi:NADPH:quinone reductase-like Zn-dependent oxidoreductase
VQNFPLTFPHIPGLEMAGVVDAVGEGANFTVGDEVFGWSDTGASAEYALATTIAEKPASIAWQEAVALPVAGETSLRALKVLDVRAGETLLVHGASGTVGRFATQLAAASGVKVIGTAGQHRLDDVKALGATPVLYGDGWLERVRAATDGPVDAVFDASGYGVLQESVELRGTKDRIVTIADAPGAAALGIPFSSGGSPTRELLDELADRVVNGGFHIALGNSYPLAEAAAAHQESEAGHPGGKITLSVS